MKTAEYKTDLCVVGGKGNQDELIEMGYQFINLGSDVRALYNYFSDIIASCSDKDAK